MRFDADKYATRAKKHSNFTVKFRLRDEFKIKLLSMCVMKIISNIIRKETIFENLGTIENTYFKSSKLYM